MKPFLVIVLCLALHSRCVAEEAATAAPAKISAERVNAAIAQLDRPEQRLAALEWLIDLCSGRLYNSRWDQIPTTDEERLEAKACEAIISHASFDTVSAALRSRSETLQYWALWFVGDPNVESKIPWNTLLPRIRELATDGSEVVRGSAQQYLAPVEGESEFLAKCAANETALDNIMRLEYGGDGRNLAGRVRPHVWRLLNDPRTEVRNGALRFIGFNSQRAPMWRFSFEDRVFQKVLELTASKSAEERASALYALEQLRNVDPKAVLARVKDRVADCDDVRWRLPSLLQDQVADPEAKLVLEKLLRDPNPNVRFWTIMALGPEHCRTELRELTRCDDQETATSAKNCLEQFDREAAPSKNAKPSQGKSVPAKP